MKKHCAFAVAMMAMSLSIAACSPKTESGSSSDDDRVLELADFIELGLASEAERATSGIATNIISQDDGNASFYMKSGAYEFAPPVTGDDVQSLTNEASSDEEDASIRVEALPVGEDTLKPGDIVYFHAYLRTDNGGAYWAGATSYMGKSGFSYSSDALEPVSISSSFAVGKYDQGLYVSVSGRSYDGLYEGYDLSISSDDKMIALSLVGDDDIPDIPLLIDCRDKEKTGEIAKEISSMGSTDTISVTGNIRVVDGNAFIAISSQGSYEINDANEPKEVSIYAINDFHGATDKIASLATYLKARKEEGSVLINSGDLWQGSLVSNSNRGEMLTKAMDEIGFDSFTLGNHEFDWGTDYIERNKNLSSTPFLAANLYHWDASTKEYGEFYDDLAEEYAIKDLSNGLRVGIIGVIGASQITSITSSIVQGLGFKDPDAIVPSLATELRDKEGCDLVLLSGHADESSLSTDAIAGAVDAVFCAHTHEVEQSTYNGVPYIQGGSYGRYVSHMSIEWKNGEINGRTASNIAFDVSRYEEDEAVQALVQAAEKEVEGVSEEELGTLDSSLPSKGGIDRLVAKAIAKEASSQGFEIDLAMTNQGRASLSAGTVTYAELFQSLPFDNIVYIAEVSGSDIYKEAAYNAFYRVSEEVFGNSSDSAYTIAIIDYLLLHQNAQRTYDYFSDGFKVLGYLEKEGEEFYCYREIAADYIRSEGSVSTSEFTSSNVRNDKSFLDEAVSF